MHGVILKSNNSDHVGHSYTVWVTKTNRLIRWTLKVIYGTTITSQEYF